MIYIINSVMKRTISSCLLFCLCFASIYSQRVYNLDTPRELGIIGGGLSGVLLSIPLQKKIKPLTQEELYRLDRSSLLKIDRYPTFNYSTSAQKISDKFLFSSPALPLLLLADGDARDEIGAISTMYLQTALINSALTSLTKAIVKRTRPYAYNPEIGLDKKTNLSTRKSFFSGHTSTTAAFSFFSAQVYHDLNPNSDFDPVVWTTAALIPAITGYLRVKGGKHFPTDVVVGYVVGALVGIFVPRLH